MTLANVKFSSLIKAAAFTSAASENNEVQARANPAPPSPWQIENDFFGVRFDLDSGRFHAWRNGGNKPLFEGAASAVIGKTRRSTSETDYARCVKAAKFQDAFGSGQRLLAQCIDRQHKLDFETVISIYDDREMIVIEIFAKNVSKEAFTFERIELARTEENRALLPLPENPLPFLKTLEPQKSASSGKMILDFGADRKIDPSLALADER